MKLTRRQEGFLRQMLDLYHQMNKPLHYSEIAERVGVSRFTAYDMLRLLEKNGFVASDYQLAADKSGPGRSEIVFMPTERTHRLLSALVGPDGAGKTTSLRILATVITPSAGTARIAGYDVVRQAEQARHHIGYMPQAFSLYPDLTVRENLDFFADIHAVPAAQRQERIPQLLQFARLEEFQSHRSAHLSGGMRKKLALACALVHAPRVLLLDEPTTGVDPVSRRELWRILAEVVQQGVTILVSTPYMDEAEPCHQVGIIYGGRILIIGPPDELA
jgi:ABC-2 type transport system ATP-binding protein